MKTLINPSALPLSERVIRRYTFGFFVGFLIVSLVEIFASYALRKDFRYPALEIAYFAVQWSIWTLLSPIIVHLAFRYPLNGRPLVRWVGTHLVLGTLFITLEFLVEIPTARLLKTWICHSPVDTVAQYLAQYVTRFNYFLLIYLFVVVCINVYLYVVRYHQATINRQEVELKAEQLRTQLADARLQALKMQLDPHFLFNTHNAVTALMLTGDNERAIRMINGLSSLLRAMLQRREDQLVTLEEELHFSGMYLDLQQIRFRDRLRIRIDREPEAGRCLVPHFILQPLIENAVIHGVEASLGEKFIRVTAQASGDRLELTVTNSYNPHAGHRHGTGIGLTNTRRRLEYLYGSRADLSFSPGPTSVTVRVTFPLRFADQPLTVEA
ncbi:sensor histidine kinase [Larkinella soli]|uniref:sensor histidine kinase n=1 Tax=Larkinella soli TaxID=1770527 RepID=UPI000FFB50FC|nr:histidine kinase [Larkinella soli]